MRTIAKPVHDGLWLMPRQAQTFYKLIFFCLDGDQRQCTFRDIANQILLQYHYRLLPTRRTCKTHERASCNAHPSAIQGLANRHSPVITTPCAGRVWAIGRQRIDTVCVSLRLDIGSTYSRSLPQEVQGRPVCTYWMRDRDIRRSLLWTLDHANAYPTDTLQN